MPLNYTIAATEKLIAPPYRGGAVVSFPIRRMQSIFGKIVLKNRAGTLVAPAYGQLLSVHGKGGQSESPIGKHGEFYLENLAAGRFAATVNYKDKVCAFAIEIPDSNESEIDLGTVACHVQ